MSIEKGEEDRKGEDRKRKRTTWQGNETTSGEHNEYEKKNKNEEKRGKGMNEQIKQRIQGTEKDILMHNPRRTYCIKKYIHTAINCSRHWEWSKDKKEVESLMPWTKKIRVKRRWWRLQEKRKDHALQDRDDWIKHYEENGITWMPMKCNLLPVLNLSDMTQVIWFRVYLESRFLDFFCSWQFMSYSFMTRGRKVTLSSSLPKFRQWLRFSRVSQRSLLWANVYLLTRMHLDDSLLSLVQTSSSFIRLP